MFSVAPADNTYQQYIDFSVNIRKPDSISIFSPQLIVTPPDFIPAAARCRGFNTLKTHTKTITGAGK